jgi:threonine/homoserine/homoserine lactone efflux protein
MSSTVILPFAAIMFVGIVTPGPTVLLALSNGTRFGLKVACLGMLGAVAADVTLVTMVGFGLGALLVASEVLFQTVKWLGVVYVAFVGVSLIRAGAEAGEEGRLLDDVQEPTRAAAFSKSFVVAMSNPKYYLFMSAFLPQFIDSALPQFPQYALLGAIIAAIDLAVMSAYALLGVRAVRIFPRSGVLWLNRLSGGALMALAGSIALYRRGAV